LTFIEASVSQATALHNEAINGLFLSQLKTSATHLILSASALDAQNHTSIFFIHNSLNIKAIICFSCLLNEVKGAWSHSLKVTSLIKTSYSSLSSTLLVIVSIII